MASALLMYCAVLFSARGSFPSRVIRAKVRIVAKLLFLRSSLHLVILRLSPVPHGPFLQASTLSDTRSQLPARAKAERRQSRRQRPNENGFSVVGLSYWQTNYKFIKAATGRNRKVQRFGEKKNRVWKGRGERGWAPDGIPANRAS